MQPTNKSSGLKTSSGTIVGGRGVLSGAHVITNGTADVTLTLYDNGSAASGNILFKQVVTGTDDAIPYTLPEGGVRADNGIYAEVSGAGAEFIIFYR